MDASILERRRGCVRRVEQSDLMVLFVKGQGFEVTNLACVDGSIKPAAHGSSLEEGRVTMDRKYASTRKRPPRIEELYPSVQYVDDLPEEKLAAELFVTAATFARPTTRTMKKAPEAEVVFQSPAVTRHCMSPESKQQQATASKIAAAKPMDSPKGIVEAESRCLDGKVTPPNARFRQMCPPLSYKLSSSRNKVGILSVTTNNNNNEDSMEDSMDFQEIAIPRPIIEVAPNQYKELRGSQETLEAVMGGYAITTTCFCCSLHLQCVPDAELVICPECRVVSPVETTNRHRVNAASSYHVVGGIGLGLRLSRYKAAAYSDAANIF